MKKLDLKTLLILLISLTLPLLSQAEEMENQENTEIEKQEAFQNFNLELLKLDRADIFPSEDKTVFERIREDSTLFRIKGEKYVESVEIDTTSNYVVIYSQLLGEDYKSSVVMKRSDYANLRLKYENRQNWKDEIVQKSLLREDEFEGIDELAIDIPFKIKSRNFHRVFGGNRIGLRVRGDIALTISYKYSDIDDGSTTTENNGKWDPRIEQTQNVSITGKVGKKVSIDIALDSEKFDFENTVKVTYEGESDEIVQRVEAGNTSLALPATRYVTYSENNEGYFGIKTKLKIGDFNTTIIASNEKGQENKKVFDRGKAKQKRTLYPKNYLKQTYFFVDSTFWKNYIDNFSRIKNNEVLTEPLFTIEKGTFRLFVTRRPSGTTSIKPISADIYIDYLNKDIPTIGGENNLYKENQNVYELSQDKYEINYDLGYIRLNSPLTGGDILSALYVKTGPGDPVIIGQAGNTPTDKYDLQIIAHEGKNDYYDRPFDKYQWRHVYSLGGTDVDLSDFTLQILYDGKQDYNGHNFLEWYDLSDIQNNNPDKISMHFIKPSYGEIWFPNLRPFAPDNTTDPQNETLINQENIAIDDILYEGKFIYDDNTGASNLTTQFTIPAEYTSKSTDLSLGFNIYENSEAVYVGSRKLERGEDYVIDYDTGQISILKDEYLDQTIEVTYKSAQIFNLDSRTMLGSRVEYRFTPETFVGGTVMYLSESTSDKRVHVGYEPIENLVWDINARTKFEVPYLTKAIDSMPLIETDQESELAIEGEFAQVIPNPNPLGTGYIDDFEGSQRTRNIGIEYRGWHLASMPDDYTPPSGVTYTLKSDVLNSPNIDESKLNYFLYAHPRSADDTRFYWYNPTDDDKYRKDEIYYDATGSDSDQKVRTFELKLKPVNRALAIEGESVDMRDVWGGVMKDLPSIYKDLREMKYIEVLVASNRDVDMYIDLGSLSEDAIPNDGLNSEDMLRDVSGKLLESASNNILEVDEDVGWDMLSGDTDFYTFNIDSVFYPSLERKYFEFLSYDNRPSGSDSDISYKHYNKTENNDRLDTEDLNGNGNLDKTVAAYRYKVSLGEDNYVVPGTAYKGNFKLYRIPLDDTAREIINSEPDFTDVEFVKLWFNNVNDSTGVEVSIVSLDFVGNEWTAEGISKNYLESKTINNIDNENYTLPPGLKEDEDNSGNKVKEQSLQVSIDYESDAAEIREYLVTKRLLDTENYLEYRKMKMFVHAGAGGNDTSWPDDLDRPLYFVYRFGTDSVNFYEYRSKLERGWGENEMVIELDSLTAIKTDRTATGDSTNAYYLRRVDKDSELTKFWGVMGKPTLSKVKYFAAGFIDSSQQKLISEMWLDELRLTDIRKNKGNAVRGHADMQFADLMNIAVDVEYKDADFHTVNERVGSGSEKQAYSLSGAFKAGKFFPQDWGIKIPLNFSYANSVTQPRYAPNTDVLVNTDSKAAVDSTRSVENDYRVSWDFSKNSQSKSPWIKYTIDNLKYSGSFELSNKVNPTYTRQESDRHNHRLSYQFSIPSDYVSFSIFSWTENISWLRSLRSEKLTLIPTGYSTSISVSRSTSVSDTRASNPDNRRTIADHNISVRENFSTGFNPISPLTIDYNLSLVHDPTREVRELAEKDSVVKLSLEESDSRLMNLDFGELASLEQGLNTRLAFKLTRWTNYAFSHNINYSWNANLTSQNSGRQISNRYASSAKVTLKNKEVMKTFDQGYDGLASLFTSEEQEDDEQEIEKSKVPEANNENDDDKDTPRGRGRKRNIRPRTVGRSSSSNGEGGVFKFLENNMRDVVLDITFSRNNSYTGIESFDLGDIPLSYQFAMKNNLDSTFYKNSSMNGSFGYSLSSGITVTKNVSIDGISFADKKSFSRTNGQGLSGNVVRTAFVNPWMDEVNHRKTNIYDRHSYYIPNYSLSIRNIEKLLPNAGDAIKSIEISHSKSGSTSKDYAFDEFGDFDIRPSFSLDDDNIFISSKKYVLSFSPLAKLSVRLKNGISFHSSIDYTFDLSENFTKQYQTLGNGDKIFESEFTSGTKKKSWSFSLTGGYNQRGGFRFPFEFWPFNGKKVRSDISYSLSLAYQLNETWRAEQQGDGGYLYQSVDNGTLSQSYSARPEINFKISKNLTGKFSYEYSQSTSAASAGAREVVTTNQEIAFALFLRITGK